MLRGGTVFSHWLLDLLVHRPDLSLGVASIKLGFALWDLPGIELALELTLFLAAASLWWREVAPRGKARALLFLAWLLGLQMIDEIMPPPSSGAMAALSALAAYGTVIVAAWRLERRSRTDFSGRHEANGLTIASPDKSPLQ